MRLIDLKRAHAVHATVMREMNRQIVLNYVRERAPISRAEIARETELQRSTISIIADDLIKDGLIEEIGEGTSSGGRRPILLRLRTAGASAIGVDITPTRTAVATSDLAGRVLEREDFATSPDFEQTLKRVIECVNRLSRKGRGIEGLGLVLPGLVDPISGKALYVPHFDWRDLDVQQRVSSATGINVTIDNDANAAALAELWFGRTELINTRDFIMVLVYEGVGTGIVLDGQIYRGAGGVAGEFGHTVVGRKAPVACSCGSYRCWEAFASERAAVARYEMLKSKNGGRRPSTFRQIIDRALAGEAAATTALTRTAQDLSIGISNLIIGFSPELVVVGGAITRAWPLLHDILEKTVDTNIRRSLPSARIIASTLGEESTLMGSLSLVLAPKFASDPRF
jgi:predicted NBD/HSP70 family sugar kinase